MEVSILGAIIGTIIAILLILKNINPTYSMMLGALLGGIIGGAGLTGTVNILLEGAQNIMPAIVRIVAAGTLAGVLAASGAAESISKGIIKSFGEKYAILALALCGYVLTAVGVFRDVVMITIAPIGFHMANNLKLTKRSLLICLMGGIMAGTTVGPVPNTIAVSEVFNVPITSIMIAGLIPSIVGLMCTIMMTKVSNRAFNKGKVVAAAVEVGSGAPGGTSILANEDDKQDEENDLPTVFSSLIGPIVTIGLLLIRQLANINIDPIIAMPVGAIVGIFAMKKQEYSIKYLEYGLNKMSGVVLLLIGTGCLSGIISNSTINELVISGIEALGLPGYVLAPIAGALLSGATASSTAGASVAAQIFAPALSQYGISPLAGGSMINSSVLTLSNLPHGSFFHISAGSVSMDIKERLKSLPYEIVIGLSMAISSGILLGGLKLFQ